MGPQEYLWKHLGPYLATIPQEHQAFASAVHQEALLLSRAQKDMAKHTADTAGCMFAISAVIHHHAWLWASTLSEEGRALAESLPTHDTGLFNQDTDDKLKHKQEIRQAANNYGYTTQGFYNRSRRTPSSAYNHRPYSAGTRPFPQASTSQAPRQPPPSRRAPFPNGGFVNGFSSPGSYKTNAAALSINRPFHRNRMKPHFRLPSNSEHSVEITSAVNTVSVGDGHLHRANSRNFQTDRQVTTLSGNQEQSYSLKDSSVTQIEQNGDYGMGRGRRNIFRGRRRREDDRLSRPQPSVEAKTLTPKFDLLASNFPPLPGSMIKTQGDPVLENRMSDIVKGISKEKENKELAVSSLTSTQEEHGQSAVQPVVSASSPCEIDTPGLSATQLDKKLEEVQVQKEAASQTSPPSSVCPLSTVKSPRTNVTSSTTGANTMPTLTVQEPRKLSYAEVCQKPPKETAPVPVQPLRELRTNVTSPAKTEENGTHEKTGEKTHHEKPEGRVKDFAAFRGSGPPKGGSAGKIREQRRQCGRRPSPQGAPRRVGKEQYVPPRSPKEN